MSAVYTNVEGNAFGKQVGDEWTAEWVVNQVCDSNGACTAAISINDSPWYELALTDGHWIGSAKNYTGNCTDAAGDPVGKTVDVVNEIDFVAPPTLTTPPPVLTGTEVDRLEGGCPDGSSAVTSQLTLTWKSTR